LLVCAYCCDAQFDSDAAMLDATPEIWSMMAFSAVEVGEVEDDDEP